MRGPEAKVEDYLRDEFKRHGWLVYKMDQGGGVADRLAISPTGFHLWIELKKPGKNTLDPAQVAWGKDMMKRHASSTMVRPQFSVEFVNCRNDVNDILQIYKLR